MLQHLNFFNIKTAISPCPNDTYMFEAWALKKISTCLIPDMSYQDVETLNKIAVTQAFFDVSKLSAACAAEVMETYSILPVGAVFSTHSGPFLVAKTRTSCICRLAIPGIHTSAFFAYVLMYGYPQEIVEMPYENIISAVVSGKCDAGILIHEAQNKVSSYGLIALDDLGVSFRRAFSINLPLGVIVGKRVLGKEILDEISYCLFSSIQVAKKQKEVSSFVKEKAQEKDDECLKKHIETFVTEDTEILRSQVELRKFFQLLKEAGLIKNIVPEDLIHQWSPGVCK